MKIFRSIDFEIDMTANLTGVDLSDVTFNFERNTYRLYKNKMKT